MISTLPSLLAEDREVVRRQRHCGWGDVIGPAGGANWGFTPFYKSLVGLRKGSTALQQGAVTWVTNTAGRGVVSYTRSDTTSTFLVILNFSNAAVTGAIAAPTNNRWVDVFAFATAVIS